MGTLHGSIFLRNRSDTKCVLEKVPEVTLLDKSGRNIPVKVEPNSELNRFGAGSPRFVLQPGRSAAVFLATDPNFDENVCGTRMIVSIQGVIVRLKMPACGPRGERPTVSLSGFVDYSRVKPN